MKLRLHKHAKDPVCLAPYNSVFFSMTGKAYYCLANREAVLGTYPAQSVDEILSGTVTQEFRKEFSNAAFIAGCEACRTHLESGTAGSAFMNFHKAYPMRSDHMPRYIDFELDNRCNLNCAMCSPYFSSAVPYSDGKHSEYQSPYDEAFYKSFDKVAPYLMKAHFRGGEPFLIPQYHEFWERLIQLNPAIRIGVTTNGTVLSKHNRSLIKGGHFDINISLDTLQEATYRNIRMGGDFNKYQEHLDEYVTLYHRGKINLSACMCLMTYNWAEFPELFEFCNINRIAVYINYVEVPEYLSLKCVTQAELMKIRERLEQAHISWAGAIGAVNQATFATLLLQLKQWEQNALVEIPGYQEALDAMPRNKEAFFKAVNQYTSHHRKFHSFDPHWFEEQISAIKTFETAGYPMDLIYAVLLKSPIAEVMEKLPTLNHESLRRKILDKYYYAVHMLASRGKLELENKKT